MAVIMISVGTAPGITQFLGERHRQGIHASLRGGIVAAPGNVHDCGTRRDVDDPPAIAHVFGGRVCADPHGGEIEPQRCVPLVWVQLGQRSLNRRSTGVVNPNVEVPKFVDCCGSERFDRVFVGHVGRYGDGSPAPLPNSSGDAFDLIDASSCADDCGSCVGQGGGDPLSYPSASPGDHCDIVGQVEQFVHVALPDSPISYWW
jgi:hypothetical protein